MPIQSVFLFTFVNNRYIAQKLPQRFKIYATLAKHFGEYIFELLNIFIEDIRALTILQGHFIHSGLIH
ncbi:hypothetical protein D3C85_1249970 [compost metagenome]